MRPLLLVTCLCLFPAVASAQVLPFIARTEADQSQRQQQRELLNSLAEKRDLDQEDIDQAVEQLNRLASPKQAQLYIIGSGAIGTAVEKKTDVEPTASGSIGFRMAGEVTQWTTLVSVLSTEPLVESNASAFVLAPASGARSLMVDWQRGFSTIQFLNTNTPPRNLGLQVQGAVSSARWRDAQDSAAVTVASVTPRLTLDVFAAHDDAENLHYGLRFDLGLPVHAVGSLTSKGRALRERMLGSRDAVFAGLDAGATLLFGKMTVTARLAGLLPFGGEVPGVTGLRFTTGIAVQPDLLNLRSVSFR